MKKTRIIAPVMLIMTLAVLCSPVFADARQDVVDKANSQVGIGHYRCGGEGEMGPVSGPWINNGLPCLFGILYQVPGYELTPVCIDDCQSWARDGQPYDCQDIRHFDCSGFVYWVFSSIGRLDLIGNKRQVLPMFQYYLDNGLIHFGVECEGVNKGDLVFFVSCESDSDSSSNPQFMAVIHVGIYAGDGYVITAEGNEPCTETEVDADRSHQQANMLGVKKRLLSEFQCNTAKNVKPVGYAGLPVPDVAFGSLKICKYNDKNLNGQIDDGESLPDWPFRITRPDGSTTDVSTESGGCITITSLDEGSYTVTELTPTLDANGNFSFRDHRWHAFTDPVQSVPVIADTTSEIIYRNVWLGSVNACKYEDLNMSGSKDGGELGISNWPVKFTGTKSNGDPAETLEPLTGPDGCYTFADLYPGTYIVSEEGNGIAWNKVQTSIGTTNYCDWQTTWAGEKWQATSPRPPDDCSSAGNAPAIAGIGIDGNEASVSFGNVRLTTLTAIKFGDRNMDGEWVDICITSDGASETELEGWPMKLVGTRKDGRQICPAYGYTDDVGKYMFIDLPPGDYTVSEETDLEAIGEHIIWETVETICSGVTYCDWRTTWNGKRWQATAPRPPDDLSSVGPVPAISTGVDSEPVVVTFGNVPLGKVIAYKFHDLNMTGVQESDGEPFTDINGDYLWTPAEPFTDMNCNSSFDTDEYFSDLNKNGMWDAAEPFTDLDSDGQYDYPECPINSWPFALDGNRADGRPICLNGTTDGTGYLVFTDIAPSDITSYTLGENLDWCLVDLGGTYGTALRTTYHVENVCTGTSGCGVADRWQATTPILKNFVFECEGDHSESFGNVCLSRLDGKVEVYDNGMPGQSAPTSGAGWKVCLAGKDHYGYDIAPSGSECVLLPTASQAPITIPCITPSWYETVAGPDGTFSFVDLLPGRYYLAEQPDVKYDLRLERPSLCGYDIVCCPQTVTIQNVKKNLALKVYQVYPGNSLGENTPFAGNGTATEDAISAVPGVLWIIPGNNWENYKQATLLGIESIGKNTILIKEFGGLSQCRELFPPIKLYQHGTPNIRLWWPLMYEAPGTTWTLKVQYGTKSAVQLPGEASLRYVHEDEWKWIVDTDIEHMKLYLKLLRETAFGLSEVPLISNEALYRQLLERLDEIQGYINGGDLNSADSALVDFEMDVAEACIASPPFQPEVSGPRTGIANTIENPACCKLLLDAEYVGRKLGVYEPN